MFGMNSFSGFKNIINREAATRGTLGHLMIICCLKCRFLDNRVTYALLKHISILVYSRIIIEFHTNNHLFRAVIRVIALSNFIFEVVLVENTTRLVNW